LEVILRSFGYYPSRPAQARDSASANFPMVGSIFFSASRPKEIGLKNNI
jgi:hypothetical protein